MRDFCQIEISQLSTRAATQDSQRQNFSLCTISLSHYFAPPPSHPPIMVSSFQHYPNMQTPRSPQPSHYLTQWCYPSITIITCNTRTRNTIISPSPSSSTYYLVMESNRQTRKPTMHSHILQFLEQDDNMDCPYVNLAGLTFQTHLK